MALYTLITPFVFCMIFIDSFKGAVSGLRQFLETESHLKMMKYAFYSILKSLFVL